MTPSNLPDHIIQQLQQLVESGKKIEAIKIFRIATGQGLKESKEFIDALALGRPLPSASPAQQQAAIPSGLNDEVDRRIREALQSGNKIEAIKIHREATGAMLKESKEYVESLESGAVSTGTHIEAGKGASHPHAKSSGCGSAVFALLILLIVSLLLAL